MKIDFRQILSFMPLIIQAISFAETLKNGTASGWEKKDAALLVVREVAGAFRFPWDSETDDAIDAAIDASVAVMHKLGVFKREEEPETALEFGIFPKREAVNDYDAGFSVNETDELEREEIDSEIEREQIRAATPDPRNRARKLDNETAKSEIEREQIRDKRR